MSNSSSPNINLLLADYLALSKESGRRNADVREAADKAHHLLKTAKDQTILDLRADPPPSPQPLYQPIFLASATKNSKVIALAVSSLQRLITAGLVPKGLVKQILETLEQVIPQGVEIQLKVLQTLVSLLTTTIGGTGERSNDRLIQGEELGQALELSHRLSTSKIPVVASTASATLRQLFMFVFERVGEEDALVFNAESSQDPNLLASLPPASFILDVPAPEHDAAAPHTSDSASNTKEGDALPPTSISLRPAARDAYLLLEDLCLLISGSVAGGPEGEPSFLRWGSLSRTFGLELVESIVSGFGPVVRSHQELLLVLRAHLCPLLIRFLSSPPSSSSNTFSFPLTLRLTRVIFLLLKQFSDLLPLESEVFLCMFVRVIGPGEKGDGDGGHPAGSSGGGGGSSPVWMRVLALEIFRGLCGDFGLMIKFYERYDALKMKGEGGSSVFSDLMMAFNRLATEKPVVLGVGAAVIYGSSLAPIVIPSGTKETSSSNSGSSNALLGGAGAMIGGAMDLGFGLAHVAGSVVGSSVGAVVAGTGVVPGLSLGTAALKLQCIDQLDKAEAPPIPDTYVFLLVLQCLSSLADGFASHTLAAYSTILASRRIPGESPPRSPAALDWETLDKSDPKVISLITVKDMAETSWPALLASLSFFISTSLDDDLFADVVTALQNFTSVCGVLNLQTPREAFFTSLCKFAMPPAVVSHIASLDSLGPVKTTTSVLSAGVESLGLGPAAPLQVGLSSRNFACLKALISVAQYLAGSLDTIWFAVFETLQNADFVIKTNIARNSKKRINTSAGSPSSPVKPGSGPPTSPNPNSSSFNYGNSSSYNNNNGSIVTKIPVLPTEADEVAIQNSISRLFEVSRGLEDEAFKWFVGALCRLNGEMIGIPMLEDGSVAEIKSVYTPSTPGSEPGTPDRSRRRSSGISTNRPLRLGEKSFGVLKLGVVSLLNVHRLIYREPSIGWNLVTSHLLLVQHYTVAPAVIRLQAAEVLDEILIAAPKDLSTAGAEDQVRRIQTQVLVALAEQAEPALRIQTSTDIEIRRMALETLFKILENSGHSFIAGWDRIFPVLRTACPSHLAALPSTPTGELDTIDEDESENRSGFFLNVIERQTKTPILVRTSFPSLQLICTDFLGALTIEEIRECISTLADFGKQADDVNVALTAGGLLWSVSDHLQLKRKDGDNELAHGELWMFLLHQLVALCHDPRQEVRDGAITTTFRSMSLYGSTLSKGTWDACMFEIIFPLVEALSSSITVNTRDPIEGDEIATQPNGPPIRLVDKQWDDSKILALSSMGAVFFEYLPKIIKTSRYDEIWSTFISLIKRSFIEDRAQVATAAMQALDRVLRVALEGVEEARIPTSWEVAWSAWDEIGHSIVSTTSHSSSSSNSRNKGFTQVNLEAYVKVILPIYSPSHLSFDLARIHRLLAILKSVLTYSKSPDYRPDIDHLTPVQAVVLEVIAAIKLDISGAPSAVLSDLAEYLTLAFVGSFDSESEPSAKGRGKVVQRVTYIALTKEVMPHIIWLYTKYKDDKSIYEGGAVERMFYAYSLPMKLKHECPAPSKYGNDQLLWKTATVNFLKGVRECVGVLNTLGSDLDKVYFEGIWRQIVEGYRGALVAEKDSNASDILEDQQIEENFDLALLISLETDVLPHIGNPLVQDDLIQRLAKCIQVASKLYELDLPTSVTSPSDFDDDDVNDQDEEEQEQVTNGVGIKVENNIALPEARFDPDFDRQAKGEKIFGTTAEVVEVGRERFGYWCLDLLFLMCSAEEDGNGLERRRIAALALPFLMNRTVASIRTYIADAPLRGMMPFPRIRQEELIYLLENLLSHKLIENSFYLSTLPSPSPSSSPSPPTLNTSLPLPLLIRSILLRSPLAHLYELHPLFTKLLNLSLQSPSITGAFIPYRNLRISNTVGGLPEGFVRRKIGAAAAAVVGVEGVERENGEVGNGKGELGGGGKKDGKGDVVRLVISCLELVGDNIGAKGW